MKIDLIEKYMNFLLGSIISFYSTIIVIIVLGYFFPGDIAIGAFTISWSIGSIFGLVILHTAIISFLILKYNREKKNTEQKG